MFARLFVIVSVAALAVAGPSGLAARDGPSCSTGPIQCCNSAQDASTTAVQALLGLLGIPLDSVTGLVGMTCNPISVFGVGGDSCNSQALCCDNNSFNGVIATGCTPVNLNL